MAKSEKPTPKYGAGRVAFMALLNVIRAEVEQSKPLVDIFRANEAALGVTYSQFRKLVKRYLDVVPIHRRGIETTGKTASVPVAQLLRAATPVTPPPSAPPPIQDRAPGEPPKGSKEWREKHGIPDPDAPKKPVFVARIPDIKKLAHGDSGSSDG